MFRVQDQLLQYPPRMSVVQVATLRWFLARLASAARHHKHATIGNPPARPAQQGQAPLSHLFEPGSCGHCHSPATMLRS